MSKAFTKEGDGDNDEEGEPSESLPADTPNYMTPFGAAALQAELRTLLYTERPKIVEIVSWAAGNGDRSENGDYIYGKRRLREIDRRVRYLTKRLESAVVVDPECQRHLQQVFFGAKVTYVGADEVEHRVQLVGMDEADAGQGKISWLSPVAKALMKHSVGDVFALRTRGGTQEIEIVKIEFD